MKTNKRLVEINAIKSGYVRSPNNIANLPGSVWYAGGPGLSEIKWADEIHIDHHERPIAVYMRDPEGKSVLVKRFSTWELFLSYCAEYGHVSKPGISPQY